MPSESSGGSTLSTGRPHMALKTILFVLAALGVLATPAAARFDCREGIMHGGVCHSSVQLAMQYGHKPHHPPPPRVVPLSRSWYQPPPRFTSHYPQRGSPHYGRRPPHGGQHQYDRGPRKPSHTVGRGEPYCAKEDTEQFVRFNGEKPRENCYVGPIPGKPCAGWVCPRQ